MSELVTLKFKIGEETKTLTITDEFYNELIKSKLTVTHLRNDQLEPYIHYVVDVKFADGFSFNPAYPQACENVKIQIPKNLTYEEQESALRYEVIAAITKDTNYIVISEGTVVKMYKLGENVHRAFSNIMVEES